MEREQHLGKRLEWFRRDLRACLRLALKYHEPHYLIVGIAESIKDFVAGKDTMLESVDHQLREHKQNQILKTVTDNSQYIQ